MKKSLGIFDVETTTFNEGNPFDQRNGLVLIGLFIPDVGKYIGFPDDTELLARISSCSILVGHNIKFDLHWLNHLGIKAKEVWDTQLGEFLLSNQKWRFPSLNQAAINYNLGTKVDIVKEMYWDNGINTDEIPLDILAEYLERDLDLTYEVYKKQLIALSDNKLRLFRLQCADLLVLQEMEYNGIVCNVQYCKEQEKECELRIQQLELDLKSGGYENIPINWDSTDHLSSFLYGGTITVSERYPVGEFKSGAKIGQTRYKRVEYSYDLPRLFDPLKGSELKKEGFYSTDDPTLKSLKAKDARSKKILELLMERSKLEKLRSSFFNGVPKKMNEMYWNDGKIHGQFNQCVVATGRLSSSKPNTQQFPPEFKKSLISEYI